MRCRVHKPSESECLEAFKNCFESIFIVTVIIIIGTRTDSVESLFEQCGGGIGIFAM